MARSDPVVRSCPACRVEVSVPGHFADPRCPRCAGPLASGREGPLDETSETLVEVRTDSGVDEEPSEFETLRDHRAVVPVEGPIAATGDEPEGVVIDETATFPGRSAGERMGPYELIKVLGKGGMGVVYEALHVELGRRVALKVMRSNDAGREELERFKREARAAAKLRHPNIVPILEVGEHEGQHYFTMTMVEGQTLTGLARSGQLDHAEAARIMATVARAIHYAHEQGVIHRDLKPSNVLIDPQGTPFVMDFGLAKDLSDVSGLTLTGIAMGSPPYMPPEQARGEFRQVDAISDVYGLGATFYECLVGKPPFGGKSLYDVIAKVLAEDPPSPRAAKPELPYDLETVCLKALEKEKWRRYPSALDMARDLDRFLQGQSIRAVRQGLTTRVGRVIARHRLQIFSMLIPIAVATALAAYVFGSTAPPPAPQRPRRTFSAEDARPGQLAKAADFLATARGQQALDSLLSSFPRLPQADVCALALEPLRERSPGLLEAYEAVVSARGPATPELLARAGVALVEAEGGNRQPVELEELRQVALAWFGEGVEGRLFLRTLQALRANRTGSTAAWIAALSGPAGPLDGAIAAVLSRSLSAGDTPEDRLPELPARRRPPWVSLSYLPPTDPEAKHPQPGRVEARPRAGGSPWSFPPYRLSDQESGPHERRLAGLVRPDAQHDPSPSAAVLGARGDRVAVGWLRFAYLLDALTGRIVKRRRLPGLAQRIDLAPAGGYLIDLWITPETTLRGCRLSADLSTLSDPEGKPFAPADLLTTGAGLRDQLWREACASVPRLDTRLEVRVLGGEGEPWRLLDLYPPGRELLDLGFKQSGWVPSVPDADASSLPPQVLIQSVRGPKRRVEVLSGARLLNLRPVDEVDKAGVTSIRPVLRLTLLDSRERRRYYRYAPFNEAEPSEWPTLAARAEAARRSEVEDPNPWLLAFLAAARARAAAAGLGEASQLEELAQRAASSEHLDPRARVELACFLDRHGFEDAADRALEGALSQLWACGFRPEWAGYGELDAGRLLADRVEECLVDSPRRFARATALARWRDAFAPALRDSVAARAGYRWRGGDFASAPQAARAPPSFPQALAKRAPHKGLAGLDLPTLVRVDHALRLKTWFLVVLASLLIASVIRYSRHSRRDLERIGKTDAWSRFAMWFQRPATRARFSWPSYLTLNDKLAFVALYLVFFAVFAVAEAGLDILLALRGAPQAILAGLPSEREASRYLELSAEREPEGLYAAAYQRRVRGQDLGRLEGPLALLGEQEPRALLLWAEGAPGAAPDAAREAALEALAQTGAGLVPRAQLALARLAGDAAAVERLEGALAEADLSFAGWRWAKEHAEAGSPGPAHLPAAPAPTPRDRDVIVIGTSHWASRLPRMWLMNMLAQPPPEDRRSELDALGRSHDWGISLARFHNALFFLIPTTLVLLIASLFMPDLHPFEPLQSDLSPPLSVRLFRALIPGVTQHQRNRPLRGVFLLVSSAYVYTAVIDHYFRGGAFAFAGSANSLTGHLSSLETAHFTGTVASAVAVVRTTHGVELILCLIAIYGLHWLDLWRSGRKVFQPDLRPDSAAPFVIPVDSASQSLFPGEDEPSLPTARDPRAVPGPFDRTEAGGRNPEATARDRLELPPSPLEATEFDRKAPRPPSAEEPIERTERIVLEGTTKLPAPAPAEEVEWGGESELGILLPPLDPQEDGEAGDGEAGDDEAGDDEAGEATRTQGGRP